MRKKLLAQMRQTWRDVAIPDASFSALPFTIQQSANSFRVDPDFTLRGHANITVTNEYFVDTVNGDDADPGTRAEPFKTWNQAAGQADVDRITLLDGTYLYRSQATAVPGRSIEVIGEGTVYYTSDRADGCSNWSKTAGQTNVYECTTAGEYVDNIYDTSVLDGNGNNTKYTAQASIANVDANAGSFYWVAGGTLYVHAIDSRALSGDPEDGDLQLLDSTSFGPTVDNRTWYFNNVGFLGLLRPQNSSATGGLKAYFENCNYLNAQIRGLDEVILQSCVSLNGGETNYDVRNTIATNYIEIDCEIGYIVGNSTTQCTTAHNGCIGTRINGNYHDTTGQVVADISGVAPSNGFVWCLGSEMSDSDIGVSFYTDNCEVWLDTCFLDGDLTEAGAGQINIRNVTVGGAQSGNIVNY